MSIPQEILVEIQKLPYKSTGKGLVFTIGNGQMNVARTLTRHLKLTEKGYKDNQVRDLAQEIEATLADNLVWCDTVEDHVEWAKPNGGCMMYAPANPQYRPELSREVAEKHNTWGSVFWKYNPDYECVYLTANGKPVARTWLYKDEDGELRTTYAMGPSAGSLMQKLTEKGYKRPKAANIYSIGTLRQHSEFSVPAYESSQGPACPMFKMDNYHGPLFVTYKDNAFHFSPKKGALNVMNGSSGYGGMYSYCMFFLASECSAS